MKYSALSMLNEVNFTPPNNVSVARWCIQRCIDVIRYARTKSVLWPDSHYDYGAHRLTKISEGMTMLLDTVEPNVVYVMCTTPRAEEYILTIRLHIVAQY